MIEKFILISYLVLKKNICLLGVIYEYREFNGEFVEEFRWEIVIY